MEHFLEIQSALSQNLFAKPYGVYTFTDMCVHGPGILLFIFSRFFVIKLG